MTVRTMCGAGAARGPQHSQNLEAGSRTSPA